MISGAELHMSDNCLRIQYKCLGEIRHCLWRLVMNYFTMFCWGSHSGSALGSLAVGKTAPAFPISYSSLIKELKILDGSMEHEAKTVSLRSSVSDCGTFTNNQLWRSC